MAIRKAEKQQAKLRMAICGPTGSGKTFTSLAVGSALARAEGTKMGVIDTERNSACLYSDKFEFDVDPDMHEFSPRNYAEKIKEFSKLGYGVLVIDSLSHAWNGTGGALEMVDAAAARERGNNKFTAWRNVTPEHNKMVEAILQYPGHVVGTMRSKMEYVLEDNANGKKVPRRIGMAPVQRDGLEYEFTIVGDMNLDHQLIVTKSRCSDLADAVIMKPGAELAEKLLAWLNDGVTAPSASTIAPVDVDDVPPDPLADDERWTTALDQAYADRGISPSAAARSIAAIVTGRKVASILDLSLADRNKVLRGISVGNADKYREEQAAA